ncbi:receptor-type tyrosine-protein phosphatase beta [Ciona intestinalis]
MGSAPSKPPRRIRTARSFVSTSSVDSLNSLETEIDDEEIRVRDITFDDVTTNSFQVTWSPPTNMQGKEVTYQLRIFPPEKIKSKTMIKGHVSTSYTFTKLKGGTSYTVDVVPQVDDGQLGCTTNAHVATRPHPPRDLKFGKVESNLFEIQWSHAKGRRSSYACRLSPPDDVTSDTDVTGLRKTSHLFKGLVPGTKYTVSVTTVTNGVHSEAATISMITAPRHVCDFTFHDVTHHEMSIKWKKPEGFVESYSLELSETENRTKNPVVINKLTRTHNTFNGLTAGRLYECKVTCHAHDISSRPQLFTECTVPLEVAGIVPCDVKADEVQITWAPSPGDVDDYDLYLSPREGVEGNSQPRGVKGNRYQFTGLVPGTTYTVGIVTNAKNKSSKRAIASFVTEPGMCGDIEYTMKTCTSQHIQWPPAAGRIDSYTLRVRREDKQDDGRNIEDLYKPYYVIDDLKPGSLYCIQVVALRDSRESSTVSGTFSTKPSDVPSLFFPRDVSTWESITCSWEPSLGGVENYRLTAKCKGSPEKQAIVSADSADYTFTKLRPSTSYNFCISAISNQLESEATTNSFTTGPNCVENLRAESSTKREIDVRWSAPDAGADEYKVTIECLEESENKTPFSEVVTSTSHVFGRLVPGSLYKVEVTPRARNVGGKPTTIEAYTKPGAVLNVNIPIDDVTQQSFNVMWWGVEGHCNDVTITLSKLKTEDDTEIAVPAIIQEYQVKACGEKSTEQKFENLDPGTLYGVRLHASGKAGIGDDAIVTQSTLAPPIKIDRFVVEPVVDDPLLKNNETTEEPEKETKDKTPELPEVPVIETPPEPVIETPPAEPVVETPTPEPVVEIPPVEPVVETPEEPITEPLPEPVAPPEPIIETPPEPVIEPVIEPPEIIIEPPADEPVVEAPVEPVIEKTTEPIIEPEAPVEPAPVEPVTEQPVSEPVIQPVEPEEAENTPSSPTLNEKVVPTITHTPPTPTTPPAHLDLSPPSSTPSPIRPVAIFGSFNNELKGVESEKKEEAESKPLSFLATITS